MTSHGKKFIVISQEEYQLLKGNQTNKGDMFNPEKKDLHRSDKEMEKVLEKDIPIDEKVRLFTKELNNLREKYDQLSSLSSSSMLQKLKTKKQTSKKDVSSPTEEEGEEERLSVMEKNLIRTLPKSSQNEAEMILEHLKERPDIIRWNDNGEVIFKGDKIPDSNLIDLISSVTTQRKLNLPLMTQTVFMKALSEVNVPESWIKNKKSRSLYESYKMSSNQELQPPKVKKIKWSSST